jgi:hypothetical protein
MSIEKFSGGLDFGSHSNAWPSTQQIICLIIYNNFFYSESLIKEKALRLNILFANK